MTDELPPPHDEADAGGFDVVFRGYDRRQVEDYIARVEITLADADRAHQADLGELAQIKQQLSETQAKLIETERRAEGRPEPASLVGERLLTMLQLAEQEAEEIVEQGHQRAAQNTADLQASLERREAEVTEAHAAAEQARLDAQRDADAVRAKAHQDAEQLWSKAKEEVEALWAKATEETNDFTARAEAEANALRADSEREAHEIEGDARRQAEAILAAAHDQADAIMQSAERDAATLDVQAKEHAAEIVSRARREVEDLQDQRDTIAAQLDALRQSVRDATDQL